MPRNRPPIPDDGAISSDEDGSQIGRHPDCTNYNFIENNSIVELCDVQIDRKFVLYIRPVCSNKNFVDLMQKINGTSKHKEFLPTEKINIDDIILAEFKKDLFRGVVIDRESSSLKVQLIDQGNIIGCEIHDVRHIDRELMMQRRFAYPITLNIPNYTGETENTAVMEHLKKKLYKRFRLQYNFRLMPFGLADLFQLADNKSVTSECLNLFKRPIYYIENIEKINVEGKNVDLTIVENCNIDEGFITCILSSDEDLFATRFTELTRFGESIVTLSAYKPQKFELCIYDG